MSRFKVLMDDGLEVDYSFITSRTIEEQEEHIKNTFPEMWNNTKVKKIEVRE